MVSSVVLSPDGKHLAGAGSDGTVQVWDALTGQQTLSLQGHSGMVLSVHYSPDGKRLASAGWGGMLKLWDATTGQVVLSLRGHSPG